MPSTFLTKKPDCLVCSENSFRPLSYAVEKDIFAPHQPHIVPVSVCVSCGFGSIWPRPNTAALEQFNRGFFNHNSSKNSILSDKKNMFWNDSLDFILESSSHNITNILDFGAGTGRFYDVIAKRITEVDYTAIEPSTELVVGSSRSSKILKYSTLEDCIANGKGDFDLIFLNHVLEHIEEPVKLLAKLKSLLAKNGVIFVAVPNAGVFPGNAYRFRTNFFRLTHLNYFNAYNLAKVVEKSGLFIQQLECGRDRELRLICSNDKSAKSSSDYFVHSDDQIRLYKEKIRKGRKFDFSFFVKNSSSLSVLSKFKIIFGILKLWCKGYII